MQPLWPKIYQEKIAPNFKIPNIAEGLFNRILKDKINKFVTNNKNIKCKALSKGQKGTSLHFLSIATTLYIALVWYHGLAVTHAHNLMQNTYCCFFYSFCVCKNLTDYLVCKNMFQFVIYRIATPKQNSKPWINNECAFI